MQSMNVGTTEVANIGPKEIRKRRVMGFVMLALGIGIAVVCARTGIGRGWYAILFLPFWMGTLGISQARKKT